MTELPLLMELSQPGRRAAAAPRMDVPCMDGLLPARLLRAAPPALPEVSEAALLRHYEALCRPACPVDGSPADGCDSPRYAPLLAPFAGLHPLLDQTDLQGVFDLLRALDLALREITGMEQFTLQPATAGEARLAALMILRAFHEMRQDAARTELLLPQGAYAPEAASLAGFRAVELPCAPDGGLDMEALAARLGPATAGILLPLPSRAGVFERNMPQVAALVHAAGGKLVYDGANLRTILGMARPGDMGFDLAFLDPCAVLAPGGPGAGAVGVKKELIPYLPAPVILSHEGGPAQPDDDRPISIGRLRAFYGSFAALARAYGGVFSLMEG